MNRITRIIIVSFILNLVWEMFQAFLFAPHFSGMADFIRIHVVAACADIIITLLILTPELFLSDHMFRIGGRLKWTILSASLGLLVAVCIERYAISTGMWIYGPYMPIIPFLGVGLTPILQMMIIPPVADYVSVRGAHS